MLLLDFDLALRRTSAPYWAALAFAALAVLVHALATAPLRVRIDERVQESERAGRVAVISSTATPPAKYLLTERLGAFEATLGAKNDLASFVGTVFEQAGKHGLVLAQAEYKLEFDKLGQFYTYQMTLPVRGDYPRLRGFVDAALTEIPCLALEDIDFKRDAIGATDAEARLRFVFFLRTEERS